MAHDHTSAGLKHRKRLLAALALTTSYMFVEAITGILTDSLVLVADAGHMLTDVAGLSLALVAIWFAQRPATRTKTFGYYRAEILAALANALLLFGVSGYIFFEAYQRFREPPEVPSIPLLVVASIGLGINLVSARLLMSGAEQSVNVRGAFLEVVSDILGSIGAIAAGAIILTTGWQYADPLFAAGVGLFILPRTWRLLKTSLDVLFEGTPAHIGIADVQQTMLAVPGAQSVHDLHVWTVTSGFIALSGHVQVTDDADRDAMLVALRSRLTERFDIEHVTIQIESARASAKLAQPCFPEQAVCYANDGVVMAEPAPDDGKPVTLERGPGT
jgi:cobalt-zinc-cadmium efflux system protein